MLMLRFVVNIEEEGGQNVSLTAEVHETTVTSGGDGPLAVAVFIFHVVVRFFLLLISLPIFKLVFILVRGSLMKAGRGWREPPAVACL